MGRKVSCVAIDAEGRDKGRTFLLTEMPATQAEAWAIRAFMAIAKGGAEIPDQIPQSIAGIAILGFKTLLGSMNYADAKPLLDEMMGCVQFIPDPGQPKVIRNLVESDIEEVATRFYLRKQVFELHTDFFARAARSTSTSSAAVAAGASLSV
jgi:hypothetical protein